MCFIISAKALFASVPPAQAGTERFVMSELPFRRRSDLSGLVYTSEPVSIPGLDQTRPVSLWLPPDYFKSQQNWPLAIFFDGQNLFDDSGTLAGGWHLHDILSARASRGATVPVVLALHHGHDRDAEMSPWPPYPGKTGQGKAVLDWLQNWLIPRARRKLHLNTTPALIGGSSLGGLLALYGLFYAGDTFNSALVMSPALWPDGFHIFEAVMLGHAHPEARIYLDHGKKESEPGHEHIGQLLFEQSEVMAEVLNNLGFRRQKRLKWVIDPEGQHNEQSWSRRLPAALDFLYGV